MTATDLTALESRVLAALHRTPRPFAVLCDRVGIPFAASARQDTRPVLEALYALQAVGLARLTEGEGWSLAEPTPEPHADLRQEYQEGLFWTLCACGLAWPGRDPDEADAVQQAHREGGHLGLVRHDGDLPQPMHWRPTPEDLNALDLGTVFRITDAGWLADDPAGLYAPDLYVDLDDDGQELPGSDDALHAEARRQGWEFLDGYSGQRGYSGPVMHPSEYLGGRMARDILADPGTYAVTTVECITASGEIDDVPAGWVVLRRHDPLTTD